MAQRIRFLPIARPAHRRLYHGVLAGENVPQEKTHGNPIWIAGSILKDEILLLGSMLNKPCKGPLMPCSGRDIELHVVFIVTTIYYEITLCHRKRHYHPDGSTGPKSPRSAPDGGLPGSDYRVGHGRKTMPKARQVTSVVGRRHNQHGMASCEDGDITRSICCIAP